MPLEIIYSDSTHFQSSKVTPQMLTMAGLMGTGMSMGSMGSMSM